VSRAGAAAPTLFHCLLKLFFVDVAAFIFRKLERAHNWTATASFVHSSALFFAAPSTWHIAMSLENFEKVYGEAFLWEHNGVGATSASLREEKIDGHCLFANHLQDLAKRTQSFARSSQAHAIICKI
jgi:hypothetical protein